MLLMPYLSKAKDVNVKVFNMIKEWMKLNN